MPQNFILIIKAPYIAGVFGQSEPDAASRVCDPPNSGVLGVSSAVFKSRAALLRSESLP